MNRDPGVELIRARLRRAVWGTGDLPWVLSEGGRCKGETDDKRAPSLEELSPLESSLIDHRAPPAMATAAR